MSPSPDRSEFHVAAMVIAPLILAFYAGFTLGSGYISGFYIDRNCESGICTKSYISTILFPVTGMLSLLAGDRAGLRYGTKRIVVFGGVWWNFWMLIISLFVNGRDDVSLCLKLASMGGMLALANLPQLLSSVHMTPTVAMALVAISSVCGARYGGTSTARITQFARGSFHSLAAMQGICLYVVYRSLSEDRNSLKNCQNDLLGAGLGWIGLTLLNAIPRFLNNAPLYTCWNLLVFCGVALYWGMYVLWECTFAREALFPAILWDDILLCGSVVFGGSHLAVSSMFPTALDGI